METDPRPEVSTVALIKREAIEESQALPRLEAELARHEAWRRSQGV